jgi:hypothetical protein
MAQLSGSKIGSRTVRCGWAHHKKDAMQSIDYTTIDQARLLHACIVVQTLAPVWVMATEHRHACSTF